MTAIIGINAYHGDAAACLVVDGQLIAAAEEERFRRVKHWAGFPSEAIRYCVSEAGMDRRHRYCRYQSGLQCQPVAQSAIYSLAST